MEETHTGKVVANFLLYMIGAVLYLLLGHTYSTNILIVLHTCKANSSSNAVKYSRFSSKEIVYAMLVFLVAFFFLKKSSSCYC